MTRSDGKSEKTLVTYPHDYATGTAFIDDMRSAHIVAYPIEQLKYIQDGNDEKIVSGSITTYQANSKGLKDEEFMLETASPIESASFKFSNRTAGGEMPPSGTATSFLTDSHYKPRLSYDSYDTQGNLKQYTFDQTRSTSYVWGYNGALPTAMAANAHVTDIFHENFEGP